MRILSLSTNRLFQKLAPANYGHTFTLLPPLTALLLLFASGLLRAEPLLLTALPTWSLVNQASMLVENGQPLTLQQAVALQHQGKFIPGTSHVLNSGIGSRPVWVHLDLINPADHALTLRLVSGTTWIDELDVFIVHNDKILGNWHTGDSLSHPYGLVAAQGYSFLLHFPTGQSDLYIRANSVDPMVLPVELMTEEQATTNERLLHYGYGFLYGFLFALLSYNMMLYIGLSERSYLYYSLYLASLILLSLAYTGHGYEFLWTGHPLFQQYVILALMILFGSSGLLFASRFLELEEHAPIALRTVQLFTFAGITLIALSIMAGSQLWAARTAFVFALLFSFGMAALGIITRLHGRVNGNYFLVAALCGLIGAASTTLSVWGWIPFTPLTYHALEYGIAIEASLLALALAYRMRHCQKTSQIAESLSRLDPLTGLLNRRAFFELATPAWSTAGRNQRPLSIIMLDIDHFKQINDQHGHDAGDRSLVATSRLLAQACRNGDILVRWGGEEFMLLLPETDLAQACAFAERLRYMIEIQHTPDTPDKISLTASFGVAERGQHHTLNDLIREADLHLYEAKQQGRNRVCSNQAS